MSTASAQTVTVTRTADASPEVPAAAETSLLELLIRETDTSAMPRPAGRLYNFLAEKDFGVSLEHWFGADLREMSRHAGSRLPPVKRQNQRAAAQLGLRESTAGGSLRLKEEISLRLSRDIAVLDRLLNDQLNAILHDTGFQKLEASWRGLRFLVRDTDPEDNVKIKVLPVSWRELARDAERAVEFDQSQLFRKVYSEQIGTPGGEPFGLLVGDYEICHRPSAGHPTDDPSVLASIAQTAAAAFAPFVGAADPSLLALESFVQLERAPNLRSVFNQPEYVKWRTFREHPDSRFVGLVMPRVLMRLPHVDDARRADGFCFAEDVSGPDQSKYLWGNAAYAFASVLIRAFSQTRWLADIRGVRRGEIGGGLVTGLPVHSFGTDRAGIAMKGSLELQLGDTQDKELSDLGLIPLCPCKDTEFSVFYSNPSAQQPQVFDRPVPTANARMSATLQYVLCASRFAHYLKVLMRDKVGSFAEAKQIEDYLKKWIEQYVAPDAAPDVRARFPLHGADVQVRDRPGMPGAYTCVMHLQPHFQLDAIAAGVRLTTELSMAN